MSRVYLLPLKNPPLISYEMRPALDGICVKWLSRISCLSLMLRPTQRDRMWPVALIFQV